MKKKLGTMYVELDYTGHYAGFLQCRRHPAFFKSMLSAFGMLLALGYYHKKSTFFRMSTDHWQKIFKEKNNQLILQFD